MTETTLDRPRVALLTIPVDIARDVAVDCERRYPLEACGLLIGPAGQGAEQTVTRWVPVANRAPDPTRCFRMDPAEQLAVYAAMDANGEDPVAVYHSHPHGRAVLSPVDAQMAQLAGGLWVVFAVGEARCWQVVDSLVSEVPVEVV